MTLGIIWARSVGGVREMVVASDSRLSGGQHWDANPKIMLLPRSDAVLSFGGDTDDAYPLMLQAWNAIEMFGPAKNRSMDLADLKGHLIRVFNHSRKFIGDLPRGQDVPNDPGAIFAISGYSWRTRRFHIWKLFYDPSIRRFTFRPAGEWGGQDAEAHKLVDYLGDDDAIDEAKRRLVAVLRQKEKIARGSFDMEPFEVLRDIIRSKSFPSVGGPIQMVKIYEHANAVPVGVLWPDKTGSVSLLGRPLMAYEKTIWGVIDPDAPNRAWPMSAYLSYPEENEVAEDLMSSQGIAGS
jgi:hypothetical protein